MFNRELTSLVPAFVPCCLFVESCSFTTFDVKLTIGDHINHSNLAKIACDAVSCTWITWTVKLTVVDHVDSHSNLFRMALDGDGSFVLTTFFSILHLANGDSCTSCLADLCDA